MQTVCEMYIPVGTCLSMIFDYFDKDMPGRPICNPTENDYSFVSPCEDHCGAVVHDKFDILRQIMTIL